MAGAIPAVRDIPGANSGPAARTLPSRSCPERAAAIPARSRTHQSRRCRGYAPIWVDDVFESVKGAMIAYDRARSSSVNEPIVWFGTLTPPGVEWAWGAAALG